MLINIKAYLAVQSRTMAIEYNGKSMDTIVCEWLTNTLRSSSYEVSMILNNVLIFSLVFVRFLNNVHENEDSIFL